MNEKLIAEMTEIANDMIPGLATFTIKRIEGVDKWSYNDIHFETQKYLELIRTNEGIDTFLMRKDSTESMCLELGFSQHDEMGAIIRELAQKVISVSKKHGIESVEISVNKGAKDEIDAAFGIKQAAMLLTVGRTTRISEDYGWTEKEALE